MVPADASIAPRMFLGLYRAAIDRGVPESSLLAALGCTSFDDLLARGADGGFPIPLGETFWREAVRLSSNDALGLQLAEHIPLGVFGFVYHSFHASDTLREGLGRHARYQRLISGALDIHLHDVPEGRVIRYRRLDGELLSPFVDFALTLLLRMSRHVIGIDWVPARVTLRRRAPSDRTPWLQAFGPGVLFGGEHDELLVPTTALEASVPSADRDVVALLDREVGERLAAEAAPTWAARVRAELVSMLRDGDPPFEAVAARLRVKPRSLQRWLSQEGTTFASELDAVRRSTSLRLVERPELGVTEIAFLAGFSDASAFTKAFRRWTGTTPTNYRRPMG